MSTITITLAGEPKGKGRPRFSTVSGQARAFTPAATRSYEANLKYAAQVAMRRRIPLDGPLAVHVVAALPIPKSWSKKKQAAALAREVLPTTKPDWDNYAKMLDALNEVVWRDDSQVIMGSVYKVYTDKPGLTVMITPISPADADWLQRFMRSPSDPAVPQ